MWVRRRRFTPLDRQKSTVLSGLAGRQHAADDSVGQGQTGDINRSGRSEFADHRAGAFDLGGVFARPGKGASRFIAYKNEKAEKAPTPSSEVEEPGR